MKKMKNKLSFDTFKIAKLSWNLSMIRGGQGPTTTLDEHTHNCPTDPTQSDTLSQKTNSSLRCSSNDCAG
ncbi:hypothetical protein GCM10011344_38150 [Dokdonia pacifica]|uniref:Uncharacterized protein n=1 Tax=Dokdonia pacifica TaxID=1627892 RepID=A0A239B7D4_9FLAO|nr:hypothetical protein [Dokdonia pacifica]GGG33702.1 hypothetical protein GCM10011344_38150 [Dokdonia pacifica]SNS03218.1 hypothetical protein SAMN06265376_105364 [Dokdonia pacifica]